MLSFLMCVGLAGAACVRPVRHAVAFRRKIDAVRATGPGVDNIKMHSSLQRQTNILNTTLLVRPIGDRDVIDLYRTVMRNKRELQQIDPSFGTNIQSLADAGKAVQDNIDSLEANLALPLAIIVNGTLAGEVGFICIDWEYSVGYIGYWLAPDYHGKGIMTTAVQMLIDIGFEDLKLHHVDITTRRSNSASKAVAKRLGFEPQPNIEDGIRSIGSRLTGGFISFADVQFDVFTLSSPTSTTLASEQRRNFFFQRECSKIMKPSKSDHTHSNTI